MRLWSLHPRYLDVKGLLALWREGLLAQNVLLGKTRAYANHPQLIRFKHTSNSVGALATYLRVVVDEAERRGYDFDRSKIVRRNYRSRIELTSGQFEYEIAHLHNKLKIRDKQRYLDLRNTRRIIPHPLFIKIRGPIAGWERVHA